METGQIIGFALAISVPSLVTLIGILVNNSRLSDLRSDMNYRFDALEKLFTEKLKRVEDVMDARIKHLEEDK